MLWNTDHKTAFATLLVRILPHHHQMKASVKHSLLLGSGVFCVMCDSYMLWQLMEDSIPEVPNCKTFLLKALSLDEQNKSAD